MLRLLGKGENLQESARICENLRFGSVCPLRFVPLKRALIYTYNAQEFWSCNNSCLQHYVPPSDTRHQLGVIKFHTSQHLGTLLNKPLFLTREETGIAFRMSLWEPVVKHLSGGGNLLLKFMPTSFADVYLVFKVFQDTGAQQGGLPCLVP